MTIQFTPHSPALFTPVPDNQPIRVAFVPAPAQEVPQAPLTLTQTWKDYPGVYLFFKNAIATDAPLLTVDPLQPSEPLLIVKRVRSLMRDPALRQTRFLWIENPEQPLPQWQFTALAIAPTHDSSVGTVPRLSFVEFRNYTLAIARGVECHLNSDKNGFILTPGDSFPANTDPFYFSTGYGAHRLKEVGHTVSLSLEQESAGCLTFDLTLRNYASWNYGLSVRSVEALSLLPAEGTSLVIVARVGTSDPYSYHIRIFDRTGNKVIDIGSSEFSPDETLVNEFTQVLNDQFTDTRQKGEFIQKILSRLLSLAETVKSSLRPLIEPFDELIHMDVALRMFFKSAGVELDPNDPFADSATLNTAKNFLISSHRYPFLCEQGDDVYRCQHLTLYANLDPLQPLNGDRTYFAFAAPSATLGDDQHTNLSLPTCYRTNLGYTIHVTPHGYATDPLDKKKRASSRLVFAEHPRQSVSRFDAPFYLVPQGKYVLSVPDYSKTPIPDGTNLVVRDDDNFLCGVTGIEYIQLSTQHPNILHLLPGQPAFAPDFIPGKVTDTDESEQRLESLGSKATTAWAYIEWAYIEHHQADLNPQFPIYFSQPKQSLLYKPSNNLLRFLEVPVRELPAGTYLPMFPYSGVIGKLSNYQQMEEQLLNPQRRKQIRALDEPSPTPLALFSSTEPLDHQPALAMRMIVSPENNVLGVDDSTTSGAEITAESESVEELIVGTTPQGLLATYSSKFEVLNTLLLARDTDEKDLNLKGLERRSPLRAAFQSSQMFLVIADSTSLFELDKKNGQTILKEYFPDNQLTIQGWTFNLNPKNWRQGKGDTDTVLIFKFVDKPLIELLEDIALWEQPDKFVSNNAEAVKKVRDRLLKVFKEAIATADNKQATQKERSKAAPLADTARDAFWSGLLALNVSLPSGKSLPKELKALESGITGDFYAQYVGSNGTPISSTDNKLEAKQSSLFGLIDYQDTSVPKTGDSGFAFQVSALQVQFQNSQIRDFSSEINLTVDKLFDEATLLLNSRSRRNIIILKGFTEEHDGVITYGFSFTGENYFAFPDSYILNTVDIVKATFSSDDNAVGQFTLWGRFNFRKLDAIDLFSFGMNTPPGLNFNDYREDPSKLALQALEVLERKGILEEARENKFRSEGNAQAAEALKAARTAVKDYEDHLRSGKEIRIKSEKETVYSPEVKAIQDRALTAIQALQSTDPTSLANNDETVQHAVRANTISKTITQIAENKQFLLFSKLLIVMEPPKDGKQIFKFDPSQITFDIDKSAARPDSLYAKFPLKLANFVHLDPNPQNSAAQPKGFLPAKTPLGSNSMPTNGFGLTFDLNLGSLGALSGAAKFVAQLLVVWQPNSDGKQEKATLFVGLKLPGIGGDVLGFPLQSVLKLSFKSVELIVDRSKPASAAYLLKIKKIALKFFVLSFPPNGQTEIVIFGNPDATTSNDAIGWYAAYAKEKPALPEGQSSGRASPTKTK
jgi:hypothetical protein